MRPSFAKINLKNLVFNYLNIRKHVNRSVMAVVKADAYGHGMEEVVKQLNSLGSKKPEYFAVALAEEGKNLRRLKVKQPILVFEPVQVMEAGLIIKHKLIPTVFTERHLNIIQKAAGNINNPIKVHIKVDTGMNRLGIDYQDAFNFIRRTEKNKNFIIDGIYTHFASSDEKDKSFAKLQLSRFNSLLNNLKEAGVKYGIAHASNSGAILDMPEAYFDMVRPGISLYGYYPSLETGETIKLKPVMSLISYVNSFKEIRAGESVSYNRRFTASQKTNIFEVPFGYADGYRRNLTNKIYCLVNGKKYPQAGTVTMDRIMFNSGKDKIKIGEKVILLGEQKKQKVDAWDWGKIIDTIPYEITCGITKRVPRIYKK